MNMIEQINKEVNERLDNQYRSLLNQSSPRDVTNNLFYVNGLLKSETKAEDALGIVNDYFEDFTFKLIYNPKNLKSDLSEIKSDYKWLINTVENNSISLPISNTAIYDMLVLLKLGERYNIPLGLIGSSQGSLIIFNAILAFSLIGGNKEYLKTCVRVCLIASLIPERFLENGNLLLENFLTCTSESDYLASAFTQEKKIPSIEGMGKHSIKWYLPVSDDVKKYYRQIDEFDENEPFVKKDYFLNPRMGCQDQIVPV